MNRIFKTALKIAKKTYTLWKPDQSAFGRNWKLFANKEYSNSLIYNQLTDDNPCMIARFGSTEMLCLTNFLGVKKKDDKGKALNYIKGRRPPWWWERSTINQMQRWSGFFPPELNQIEKFCELMYEDMLLVDILGSWLKQEEFFDSKLRLAKRIVLEDMEPFFSTQPWTKALEGKKVLVVHPFNETIEKQYKKRSLLFENNLLPEFELKTIKAVQSIAGERTEFSNWFEALESMKNEIDKTEYDICILGAGAYGFPLAAHVKRTGKKAIHLAGVTQLLFGIIGRRWESFIVWPYMNLFNENWVRPDQKEKPKNAKVVEDACYW
jgi:hypothetical protein